MTRTDLAYHRGEHVDLQITWLDASGNSIPLDGVTFTFRVKSTPRGPELFTSTGFVLVDEANGIAKLQLTPTDTEALTAGNYLYEIDANEGNNLVKRLFSGRLHVRETGEAAACPEALTVRCNAQGLTEIVVATEANDFGLTEDSAGFVVKSATSSTVPSIATEPAPGGATLALVSRRAALDSDGTANEIALYEVRGPDGTYTFRGL